MTLTIRNVASGDHDQWAALFRGYREFYTLAPSDDVVERVWSWLLDDEQASNGLVALDGDRIVGLAHWRRFSRPSTGTVGLWLDDLFTVPQARGGGVGRALIAELQQRAAADGCSVVRWITASDNAVAQRLYDDVATKTSWLTYDAAPAASGDEA